MELIKKYFPEISTDKLALYNAFHEKFAAHNEYVNLISRKDIDYFAERHVLHSLAIAKFTSFADGSKVMDLGCGGGFPGIPLAVFFPEVQFTLVDSIAKKMRAVRDIVDEIGLTNVKVHCGRAEEYGGSFDFVVSRAVAPMESLIYWSEKQIKKESKSTLKNGIIALKGGDLREELKGLKTSQKPLSEYFTEDFFETKKLVYWKK